MSKIQFAELQATNQLCQLSDSETNAIVGGRRRGRNQAIRNKISNKIINKVNVSNVVQINNNVNIQIAFNGDNFNIANLENNAGVSQSA